MYLKYSLGFLIGSLIQAGIVMMAEKMGISHMGAKLTFVQLLLHIGAGQIAGYLLLNIIRKAKVLQDLGTFIIGIIWGGIIWAIVIPLNAAQGKVKLPWEAGTSTVISSILAFFVFGIIATYTIKHYGYRRMQTEGRH
ncbi:hypothetical protein [Falsibacillus pallidus]|uniref:Uncharacterized protein n=1 Tax=Falsibacillus pallidus TaxID=493781 RepID=A0A370G3Y1_9BACI|nr:hypothetical protein [Falsibacillus pallidus]RDI37549.1 hypothetical protein DFR59_12146 [Falsibacillus pallidus]